MENEGFLKQIKDKGNGQALIYIDQKLMKQYNLKIGKIVRIIPE